MMKELDINSIKEMRLEGMTFKEIMDYYGARHKNQMYRYFKKNNITFWKLPKKCKYCKKVFVPKYLNQKFCSYKCRHYSRLEDVNRNVRNYLKRMNYKKLDLNRNNPIITYEEAISLLHRRMESSVCEFCNGNNFSIIDGNIVCMDCGLVL